jgi:hypothetical protein
VFLEEGKHEPRNIPMEEKVIGNEIELSSYKNEQLIFRMI